MVLTFVIAITAVVKLDVMRFVATLGFMEKRVAILVAVALFGCSSSTDGDAAPFKCALGELRGTWRLTYVEKDGTCGPIADETVILTDSTASPSSCQQTAQVISADKCRMDLDFTCQGANGSQRWVGATKQVAEDRLVGDMTAEARAGGASCRSTYEITWTRQ